jgi:hypothetical protein
MASFISDVAGALSRSFANSLRGFAKDRQLARGEILAIATVMEIAGLDSSNISEKSGVYETPPTWERLEASAKADLDLVKRARSNS